jgi:hypothetical protein
MYALFVDSDDARVSVPERDSVIGTFYHDHVLTAVVNHYITNNPRPKVPRNNLLYKNAPVHRSALAADY